MALGEDVAETDASVNTKVPSCGRWNSGEQEPQQPVHLEAERGPLWRAGAGPDCVSGVFLSQAHIASGEPVADRSEPALRGPLPSASMGTGDLHSAGSHMEENKLPASQDLYQRVQVLGTITVCSEHDADSEDNQSPVESPQVLGLSQQPHISRFPLLSQWKTTTFCCQLEELICWLYNVTDVADLSAPPSSTLTGLKSSLQLYRQFKKDIDKHQSLTESVLEKGEILLQCLMDNTPVLKDVLGRIAEQSGELESCADHLYDSILASLDMLAGCTLIPDHRPTAAKEHPPERL
ncbi:centrosomal protein of 68 kDa isoform X4 [Chionomys nivalis]|uniref:centrosomal protein of 68 kDa isoform X4 n=1 Tax=Chionomys nivalis TaxID=269649 RepID=UPI002594D08F|nr:centrosomal protein of 68 kDa isoform X4 [Chionomys nivalis]